MQAGEIVEPKPIGLGAPAAALTVTVITPTYGQARYIGACLASVLGQTHRRIEHLVFDALSPDGTDAEVARFSDDPRLFYVREADRGQADGINKGLDRATGDIVCWLNSDDLYFDARVLERVAGIFADHPEIDVITGNGYYVDDDGRFLKPFITPHPARNLSARGMLSADHMLQPATFWRRNALRLDTSLTYTFDWKFFNQIFRAGLSVCYVPEYLAKYRLQPNAKTVQDSARRKAEVCRVLAELEAPAAQRAWASGIRAAYQLAEATRIPAIKLLARTANRAMGAATAGRIVSC